MHDISSLTPYDTDASSATRAPYLPLTPAAFHVLLALADGPKHGYLILKDVEERTGGDVRLSTGTLYGLIKRFLDDELIVETAGRRRWPRAAPALQAHRLRPPGGARGSRAPRANGLGRARREAACPTRITMMSRRSTSAAVDVAARLPRGVRPRNDAGVRRQPGLAALERRRRRSGSRFRLRLDQLRIDLRHAMRGLRRQKTFTITAVTTLALALGPATAVFSLINGVLLDPLPGAQISIASCLRLDSESGTQSSRVSVERAELRRSSRREAGPVRARRLSPVDQRHHRRRRSATGRMARGCPRTCSTCSASPRRAAAASPRRTCSRAPPPTIILGHDFAQNALPRQRPGRPIADRRRPADGGHRRAAGRIPLPPTMPTISGSRW